MCFFVFVSVFAAGSYAGDDGAALIAQALDTFAHQDYLETLRAAGFRGSVHQSAYRGRPAGAPSGVEGFPLSVLLGEFCGYSPSSVLVV